MLYIHKQEPKWGTLNGQWSDQIGSHERGRENHESRETQETFSWQIQIKDIDAGKLQMYLTQTPAHMQQQMQQQAHEWVMLEWHGRCKHEAKSITVKRAVIRLNLKKQCCANLMNKTGHWRWFNWTAESDVLAVKRENMERVRINSQRLDGLADSKNEATTTITHWKLSPW